jgi:hypothetical protein
MFAKDPFAHRVFWNRPRLGQQEILPEMIAPRVPNRLDELTVDRILQRHLMLILTDGAGNIPASRPSYRDVYLRGKNFKDLYDATLRDWSDQDYATLVAIFRDPTEDELKDLALIDEFFRVGRRSYMKVYAYPDSTEERLRGSACSTQPGGIFGAQLPGVHQALIGNPFFCPGIHEIPLPKSMYAFLRYPEPGYPKYFGIRNDLPWEEVKGPVLRSIAVLDALVNYPFPSPISLMPSYWYAYPEVHEAAKTFIHQDIIINRALARLWITFAIIGDGGSVYNNVSARIIHDLEKEARDAKRMAIIRGIGLAAVFAIITAGLGAALAPAIAAIVPAGVPLTGATVASAITSGVKQAMTYQEKKDATDALEKISDLFAQSDPAFAAEASKLAETFGFLGEKVKELTAEGLEAAAEGKRAKDDLSDVPEDPAAPPPNYGLTTNLLVGGGVAAAGVAALAWAIFS